MGPDTWLQCAIEEESWVRWRKHFQLFQKHFAGDSQKKMFARQKENTLTPALAKWNEVLAPIGERAFELGVKTGGRGDLRPGKAFGGA